MSELTLAAWAHDLQLDAVPRQVREAASIAFANAMGVAIGGLEEEATARAISVARRLAPGVEHARIIGTGVDTSVDQAAFVMGVAAHVLDFDDTELATIYHPSAAPLGSAMAIGQYRDVSGAEGALAWIIGLEIGIRVAAALGMPHYDRGWHATGTAGSVATAAVAARLLDLDTDRMASALSIGATMAGGHRTHFGTDTKSGHAGFAAQRGVQAALLAETGFTASNEGIGGRRGLLGVVGPDGDHDALVRDLGSTWRLLGDRIKPYASGVVTHPAIDAGRELGNRLSREPRRVASVDLRVHPLVVELTGIETPATGLAAKFSVAHCFTVGFLRDKAGPSEFTDESARDETVQMLRRKITVRADERIAHMTVHAVITLSDASRLEVLVDPARGSDHRPLTDAEVEHKFEDLVASRMDAGSARVWFRRLRGLESEVSLRECALALDASCLV